VSNPGFELNQSILLIYYVLTSEFSGHSPPKKASGSPQPSLKAGEPWEGASSHRRRGSEAQTTLTQFKVNTCGKNVRRKMLHSKFDILHNNYTVNNHCFILFR